MMKIRFVLFSLLFLVFAVTGCDQQTANHTSKTGVVDLARLMRESNAGKDGMKFIETQQVEMQKQLDEIQDRLEKNPQDEKAMQELQKVYASSQQRIQAEGQNVANQILDLIQRTLNTFREKNNYDVILGSDALAAYNPALDITNAVLAEVNQQKLEFKPLPTPGLQAPANAAPVEKPVSAPTQNATTPAK